MATPPELPEHTLNMVTAGIKMLTNIAMLDLQMFQVGYFKTTFKNEAGRIRTSCIPSTELEANLFESF